ncbi:HAD family phosphatase [Salipiger sp. PrR002]|uniref:HAD family hydrolase n=1 Tax=Salipiger sp. PrR002 TaxID=2706489 RepID=UPI0013B9A266|nr:HAD family phosphatase [Salipiger sp. PrR002]NDW01082.1 HAD family phosphatase [Salipiger sp. PrR002]NDW57885.1 HAD family phosphatase [Salipiger sp. PrR004]
MSYTITGVLLDMDGLLLDTERLQMEVGPDIVAQFGHSLPLEFFRQLVGVARLDAARIISNEVGETIDHSALDQAWDEAMDRRMKSGVPLRPGVAALFDALDRLGLPRAVATNSMTARAEWKLEHASLLHWVDAVVGVDQVELGKPAPDVYLKAAELIGQPPAACAAFDDSDLGVRAALEAGVGVVFQIPDLAQSKDSRAHHEVHSLDDARAVLGM